MSVKKTKESLLSKMLTVVLLAIAIVLLSAVSDITQGKPTIFLAWAAYLGAIATLMWLIECFRRTRSH